MGQDLRTLHIILQVNIHSEFLIIFILDQYANFWELSSLLAKDHQTQLGFLLGILSYVKRIVSKIDHEILFLIISLQYDRLTLGSIVLKKNSNLELSLSAVTDLSYFQNLILNHYNFQKLFSINL